MRELTAEDYDYRLPDHWIDHERKAGTFFERLHAAYTARVIEILKSSGAKSVLEVGCGDGWICGQMVKAGLDVVGVDWSKNAIAFASLFVPNARFFCGDVRSAEFMRQFPNQFDALAFIEVIEHIPPRDCVGVLTNISERLKLGGTLVLTTPSVNMPNTHPHHYRHFTVSVLIEIAAEAGLTVKAIEGYGDIRETNRHWSRMRWVENRYYSIKPAVKKLTERFNNTQMINTPIDHCLGFVATLTKSNPRG